ncbi:MAG: hypothetical protein K2L52_07025, partial [Clostridia bacterium]|nr:hypothetical protein [Clostridia bacterium]
MNSKTLRAKYLKSAILIIFVCFLLGAISACLPLNISIPELGDNSISDTAMTITTNPDDGLGEFNNGYSYVYTDKELIDDFRAGDPDTPYDISVVKVDTTKGRGTQENPYVIADEEDWITFVKWCATTGNNYGSGKYFVLGNDLDFSSSNTSVAFQPVAIFSGTFYGMGHSIKNITLTTWQYWNGSSFVDIGNSGVTLDGYGVFCEILSSTISDLIIENYTFPNGSANMWKIYTGSGGHGPYFGGIAGVIYSGDNAILNCHTEGSMTVNSTGHIFGGGIAGVEYGTGAYIMYRCSAELTATTTNSNAVTMMNGLLGRYWPIATTTTSKIYDCVANIKGYYKSYNLLYVGAICDTYGGSTVTGNGSTAIGNLQVSNFVGTIDVISSTVSTSTALIFRQVNQTTGFTNCYAEGTWATSDTGARKNLYAYNSATSLTANNVNTVSGLGLTGSGTNSNTVSSTDALTSSAKTFFGASYPQIWDTSKIGGSYDPDNSPVRNYLMAFIDFRNLTKGGDDKESVGLPDGEPYVVGDKLPDATSEVSAFTTYLNNKNNSNHEFLGWTDDPTGKREPFAKLPAGFFGDVTLYAVWGLPDSYVTSN